jgi:hypothetical protein
MNVTSLVTIALLAASSAAVSQTTVAPQEVSPVRAGMVEKASLDGVRLAAQTVDWTGTAGLASVGRADVGGLSSPIANMGTAGALGRDMLATSDLGAAYTGGDDLVDEGPQPSSLAMLLAGLGVLAFVAARRGSV